MLQKVPAKYITQFKNVRNFVRRNQKMLVKSLVKLHIRFLKPASAAVAQR